MLWTCLLFPSLPLDVFARARSPDDAPRAFVVSGGGRYPRVVAADATARASGIRNGVLVSAALALVPELVLRDRDAEAERRALAQLATWALTFTPMACLAPPDAIVAEIGGSLRLFDGLPRLVARLVGGAHALGYTARVGIASTPGAALLLARAGHTQPVTDRALLPAVLAPIPLVHFDLPGAVRATLREAGITTIGQVAALPRDGLARRFGSAIVDGIDHALGRAPDPRACFVPPPHFASRLELPAPAHDAEALSFGVQRLVQELAGWLAARGLGVVRLTLTLAHERHLRQRGMPATVAPFAFGAPARAPARLLGVLRERLVRVTLPASVETIALMSDETAPLPGRNLGLLPGDDVVAMEIPLRDRLRARLGDDALLRLVPHAEHRPELALRTTGVGQASSAPTKQPRGKGRAASAPPLPDAPRPLWLLPEPQPLAHPLATRPWVLRDGPERIESGWWDGNDVRRDYFVAATPAGATMWIYRDHRHGVDDGEWFLHGIFS
ncbi:MAG: DNA polymerase Y family protein [Burkholderiales bacterium]|nr:DNA polymerase Y family protein [Burkholderiales bacterium]